MRAPPPAREPDREFLARPAVEVAHDLIGCGLLRGGVGGMIVEAEAYDESEPAAHSFAGRTPRARTLFGPPGTAYVYLSYGIHHLFNIVVEAEGHGAAVLIRALEPRWGMDRIRARRGSRLTPELCSGPGKVGQALGAEIGHSGRPLAAAGYRVLLGAGPPPAVLRSPRVGISKATDLPWRFSLAGSRHVSRPHPAAVAVAVGS